MYVYILIKSLEYLPGLAAPAAGENDMEEGWVQGRHTRQTARVLALDEFVVAVESYM